MSSSASRLIGRWAIVVTALFAAISLFKPPLATAATPGITAASAQPAQPQRPDPLGVDELGVLVARIALYPDELVALIATSTLYPLQIVEAARFLDRRKKDSSLKPKESWDGSVIGLLNYPEVITMLADDLDWLQRFGDAVAFQQDEMLAAIQLLRSRALSDGIIKSDDKLIFSKERDIVVIKATQPGAVFVPTYNPALLYAADPQPVAIAYNSAAYPNYWYPTATFFAGAVTGAVFASVIDWDSRSIWGGHFDGGDIDINCNQCMNNIDINGKLKFKDVDWKNIDINRISFDSAQFAKVDGQSIKSRLEATEGTSIQQRARAERRSSTTASPSRSTGVRDVRATRIDGTNRPIQPAAIENSPRPTARTAADRLPAVGLIDPARI